MIDATEPSSWQDLQRAVARILREAGVDAQEDKPITLARGEVSVDVWAKDKAATPQQTYIIECKRWRQRVPQMVVHSFRSVVGDSGANWGAIVSASGFQRGARDAAKYTNVRLLSWNEFQSLFVDRWFLNYFVRELAETSGALIDYTEPFNSRVFKMAEELAPEAKDDFLRLRKRYSELGTFSLLLTHVGRGFALGTLEGPAGQSAPTLPLRLAIGHGEELESLFLPSEILDAASFRALLAALTREVNGAVTQFDEVFREVT